MRRHQAERRGGIANCELRIENFKLERSRVEGWVCASSRVEALVVSVGCSLVPFPLTPSFAKPTEGRPALSPKGARESASPVLRRDKMGDRVAHTSGTRQKTPMALVSGSRKPTMARPR